MRFETATPDAILLFDGVFLQRPELLSYWDVTVFVDAPFNVTVARMAERDGATPPDAETVENRRYVEGQRLYLQECDPRHAAMFVFNNENLVSPDLLYRKGSAHSRSLSLNFKNHNFREVTPRRGCSSFREGTDRAGENHDRHYPLSASLDVSRYPERSLRLTGATPFT
jgi:hypothetical protein